MSGTPLVLGGPLSPLAWGAGFVEASLDDAVEALEAWWRSIRRRYRLEPTSGLLLAQLRRLDPLEAPYTCHLLVGTRSSWTACFDNSIGGGDQTSWCAQLSRELGTRCVLAEHVPPEHYPYPSTQLELLGPEGEPPLLYIRTLSAGVYDDERWEWYAAGPPQSWEDVTRYTVPRIRDRLDRDLLVHYLACLGITVDEPEFYGDGVLVRKRSPMLVRLRGRRETIASLQREYGIAA